LQVEKLADGDVTGDRDIRRFAAVMRSDPVANCCTNKRK
jgi:hypothetical protein